MNSSPTLLVQPFGTNLSRACWMARAFELLIWALSLNFLFNFDRLSISLSFGFAFTARMSFTGS